MSVGKAYGLVLGILLVLLLAWAIIQGVGNTLLEPLLPHLRVALIVRTALHTFFENLAVTLVVCGLITFSLLLSPADLGGIGTPLIRVIRPVLYIIVVAGVINGIWFGVFAPRTELRIQQIGHQSRAARDSLKEAERQLEMGSWETAEEQLLLHQALAGESEEVADLLRRARAGQIEDEQLRRASRGPVQEEVPPWMREAREMTVPQLIARAREYLEGGDFFSAHHYATLAIEQSSTPRQDARRIQSDALNLIERGSLARDEATIRQLYQDKVAAYEAFVQGETIPEKALEAYYRFQDLETRIPEDPDVRRFAPEARRRAGGISFFVEEARSNESLPGRSRLVFINRRTAEGVEMITVDNLVRTGSGDFLYGIEVMRTSGRDEIDLHLRARYGKVIGDRLVMRAITREGDYREGEANVTGPVFFTGSALDMEGSLVLHHRVEEFARFAGGADAFSTLSLPELMNLSPLMEDLGRSPRIVQGALLNRILRIGGFFIVTIYSISLGWHLRSRYVGRPPLVVLLLMPIIPGMTWWIITIVRYLLAVSTTVLASLVPLSAAIALTAAGIMMATILAMFSLAHRKVEL